MHFVKSRPLLFRQASLSCVRKMKIRATRTERTEHRCSKCFSSVAISSFITRDATNKLLSPISPKATVTLPSVKQAGGIFLTKLTSKAQKRKEGRSKSTRLSVEAFASFQNKWGLCITPTLLSLSSKDIIRRKISKLTSVSCRGSWPRTNARFFFHHLFWKLLRESCQTPKFEKMPGVCLFWSGSLEMQMHKRNYEQDGWNHNSWTCHLYIKA